MSPCKPYRHAEWAGYQYDSHVRAYYFWTAMGIYLFSEKPISVEAALALAVHGEPLQ